MTAQRRTTPLYCEMCGAPITGRAYRIVVEGTEMMVCERCYSRYMERSMRTGTDEPLRYRLTTTRRTTQPAPREPAASAVPALRRQQARRPAALRKRETSLGVVERYEVVEDYAERIRRARQRLGLTQRELAQKVRVGENVIKRIEAGTLVPPIDLARRLERVLGVKLLEPVVEEELEASPRSRRDEFYLTLGDIAEIRED
ncbi:multiprotein bridging factor aMBF1 [Hyperthermus butylicus]|uniref:Conserved archaeal protein n=1 Tax=Hyperthermus butylicus (strain DSM 5456 / JCM 9403 / PLM1-5) TaxID=415426 RepID=A2BLW5_HYPBU|nr:multiprotein bridging factor aMBF1 [Hyperthermus butylicus]ABM80976.1 conserved archaeal protein [Hyperthermus butylicus DSM 5456]